MKWWKSSSHFHERTKRYLLLESQNAWEKFIHGPLPNVEAHHWLWSTFQTHVSLFSTHGNWLWKIKQRIFILGREETFAIYFCQDVSSLPPYSSRMAVPGESPYPRAASSFTGFSGHQCRGPLITPLGTLQDVYKQKALWQARNSTLLVPYL